jgi:hypothetical protein
VMDVVQTEPAGLIINTDNTVQPVPAYSFIQPPSKRPRVDSESEPTLKVLFHPFTFYIF